jgi:hypothetical protein
VIIDFDDFYPGNTGFEWLYRLKEANPLFKATLFAVPGLGSQDFWDSIPDWLELAMHGWLHPHPTECIDWSYEEASATFDKIPYHFKWGWKSPGWQISDGTYQALLERDWWVADKAYNNHRRPQGLRHHLDGEPIDGLEHWHGHIQNVCGNGLEETFHELLPKVEAAKEFRFISEVVHL